LLPEEERREIDVLLRDLHAAVSGNDADAIDEAVRALAKGTESFAAARMNRSIQQALTGRSVEQF
jgi:molecular chaperone HscA